MDFGEHTDFSDGSYNRPEERALRNLVCIDKVGGPVALSFPPSCSMTNDNHMSLPGLSRKNTGNHFSAINVSKCDSCHVSDSVRSEDSSGASTYGGGSGDWDSACSVESCRSVTFNKKDGGEKCSAYRNGNLIDAECAEGDCESTESIEEQRLSTTSSITVSSSGSRDSEQNGNSEEQKCHAGRVSLSDYQGLHSGAAGSEVPGAQSGPCLSYGIDAVPSGTHFLHHHLRSPEHYGAVPPRYHAPVFAYLAPAPPILCTPSSDQMNTRGHALCSVATMGVGTSGIVQHDSRIMYPQIYFPEYPPPPPPCPPARTSVTCSCFSHHRFYHPFAQVGIKEGEGASSASTNIACRLAPNSSGVLSPGSLVNMGAASTKSRGVQGNGADNNTQIPQETISQLAVGSDQTQSALQSRLTIQSHAEQIADSQCKHVQVGRQQQFNLNLKNDVEKVYFPAGARTEDQRRIKVGAKVVLGSNKAAANREVVRKGILEGSDYSDNLRRARPHRERGPQGLADDGGLGRQRGNCRSQQNVRNDLASPLVGMNTGRFSHHHQGQTNRRDLRGTRCSQHSTLRDCINDDAPRVDTKQNDKVSNSWVFGMFNSNVPDYFSMQMYQNLGYDPHQLYSSQSALLASSSVTDKNSHSPFLSTSDEKARHHGISHIHAVGVETSIAEAVVAALSASMSDDLVSD